MINRRNPLVQRGQTPVHSQHGEGWRRRTLDGPSQFARSALRKQWEEAKPLRSSVSREPRHRQSGQCSRANFRSEGWPRSRAGREKAVSSLPLSFSFLPSTSLSPLAFIAEFSFFLQRFSLLVPSSNGSR